MARTTLVETDIPGVFRNTRNGQLVNDSGVLLSFAKLKSMDEDRWTEVNGSMPKTPAELLKTIAFDPRFHIDVRIRCAKDAAPFYDMRMPLRVETEDVGSQAIDMAKLSSMKRQDRETLLKLLKEAGVTL